MNARDRGWIVAAVFVAIAAASLFLAFQRFELSNDVTAMLPTEDTDVANYFFVAKHFRTLDALYIDVGVPATDDGAIQRQFAAADEIYERLLERGGFNRIHYKTTQSQLLHLAEVFSEGKALFLDRADLERFDARLTDDYVRDRLARAKRIIVESAGPFAKNDVLADPLGLRDALTEKFEALSRQGSGAEIVDGVITSSDGRHILLVAEPDFLAEDTERSAELVEFLKTLRADLYEKHGEDNLTISYTGGYFAHRDNAEVIRDDMERTLTALTIGLTVLGFLFFRKRILVPLIFLPAGFGMAVGAGVYSLFNPSVPGIAVGCAAILVSIAVDYGVHILYRFDSEGDRAYTAREAVRSMLLPLAMGASTTAIAFLSMRLSSVPGQREMGLLAALGIVASAVFAIFALPYFVPKGPPRIPIPAVPLVNLLERWLRWQTAHKKWVAAATAVVVGVSAAGLSGVTFEGDLRKLNYLRPEHKIDDDRIAKVWQSFSPSSVVVRGDTPQEALKKNDEMAKFLAQLEAKGKIQYFTSLAPVLPSKETQLENWSAWTSFWTPEKRHGLEKKMDEAANTLGFAEGAFSAFFASLDHKPSPVTSAEFEGTGVDELIRAQFVETPDGAYAASTFFVDDVDAFESVRDEIARNFQGAIVIDTRWFSDHIQDLAWDGLLTLALLAAGAVTLCLASFLHRPELVVHVLLPIVLSVAVTLGILGHLGVSINLVSILFIIFIFGVGVDFSIFLAGSALSAYRTGQGHEASASGSVILCAGTTLCGFASLALAEHPALYSMGVTGFTGIASSLVIALAVTPVYSAWLFREGGRYGTPSFKTAFGGVWAFADLMGKTLFYLVVLRPFVYLKFGKDVKGRQRFVRRYTHWSARTLLSLFPYWKSDVKFVAADPETLRAPAVIVSNHQSSFDIPLAFALPCDFVVPVKRWVWKAPFMGAVVRDAGHILVEGDDPDALIEACAERLAEGVSVLFFAEGSRSEEGVIRRYRKGAFELAMRTKADVVPVLITNSQSCIRPGAWWIGEHNVVVRVLPRLKAESFADVTDARELAKAVRKDVQTHASRDWRLAQDSPAFWQNLNMVYNYRGMYVDPYVRWKLRLDPIYKGVDNLVPHAGRILDLGSGFGIMSNVLAWKSLQRDVIGIDADPWKVNVALGTTAMRNNLDFRQGDIMELDERDADCVLLVDVLHYWSPDRQLKLIERAAAALGPGGTLVFRDALKAEGSKHRATAWGEVFTTAFSLNKRNQGLYFCDRYFYLRAFGDCGLTLKSEHPELGRGSNLVLVFEKAKP